MTFVSLNEVKRQRHLPIIPETDAHKPRTHDHTITFTIVDAGAVPPGQSHLGIVSIIGYCILKRCVSKDAARARHDLSGVGAGRPVDRAVSLATREKRPLQASYSILRHH